MDRIPPQAGLIAQSNLVPQISHRHTIQLFGYSDPSLRPDYYFLDTDSRASRWPFPPDYDRPYVEAVARVKVDAEYILDDEREGYLLIRREIPDLMQVVNATFDDQITLVSHHVTAQQVMAGGNLELILYWQPRRKPDTDYTLFVHLVGAGGKRWGQSDGNPVGKFPPTSAWEPGRLLRGQSIVPVARELPPASTVSSLGCTIWRR
ncbi:MAG: hypothetical protein HYY30_08560 [Chloroflexi bacterium]|nr:hypothetical protein [Chloroflexota bacterium]